MIKPMFTITVRQVANVDGIASLVRNPANDHFTISINPVEWQKLDRTQRTEVLMHEMGHVTVLHDKYGALS